jgi:hypothetical protein
VRSRTRFLDHPSSGSTDCLTSRVRGVLRNGGERVPGCGVLRRTSGRCVGLAIVAGLAGCGGPGPELRTPGDGFGAGIGLPDVAAGQPMIVGSLTLCLSERPDSGTSATVTAVRAADPDGGVVVDGYAVVEHVPGEGPGLTGAEPGVLSEAQRSGVEVSGLCPAAPEAPVAGTVTELLVQVSKERGAVAWTDGLVVEYEVEGRRAEVAVPVTLHLCPGLAWEPDCLDEPGVAPVPLDEPAPATAAAGSAGETTPHG